MTLSLSLLLRICSKQKRKKGRIGVTIDRSIDLLDGRTARDRAQGACNSFVSSRRRKRRKWKAGGRRVRRWESLVYGKVEPPSGKWLRGRNWYQLLLSNCEHGRALKRAGGHALFRGRLSKNEQWKTKRAEESRGALSLSPGGAQFYDSVINFVWVEQGVKCSLARETLFMGYYGGRNERWIRKEAYDHLQGVTRLLVNRLAAGRRFYVWKRVGKKE